MSLKMTVRAGSNTVTCLRSLLQFRRRTFNRYLHVGLLQVSVHCAEIESFRTVFDDHDSLPRTGHGKPLVGRAASWPLRFEDGAGLYQVLSCIAVPNVSSLLVKGQY